MAAWAEERTLGYTLVKRSQLKAPGDDIRARRLVMADIPKILESMRNDRTKRIEVEICYRTNAPFYKKKQCPPNLIERVRKAVKDGTLMDLGYPAEVHSGNHRRHCMDILGEENKQDVRHQVVHAKVMYLNGSAEDERRMFECGHSRNILDEVRVTTRLRGVIESFRDQWMSNNKPGKGRMNRKRFVEQRLSSWRLATKKFTKKGDGFGKSLLEIVVNLSKWKKENWKVFQRWFNPELNKSGKLSWPPPKDFSLFTAVRDLSEDEYVRKINLHLSNPKKYSMKVIKKMLRDERCE
jgi:hypothetical protein